MEDDKSMDLDLYTDLLTSETELTIKGEVQHKFDEQQHQIDALKSQNDHLEKQNKILLRNISSLYKTAKMEIARKDRRMQELQEELDAVIFRRKRQFQPNDLENSYKRDIKMPREYNSKSISYSEENKSQLMSNDNMKIQVTNHFNVVSSPKPELLSNSGVQSSKEVEIDNPVKPKISEINNFGNNDIKTLQRQLSSSLINKYKMIKSEVLPSTSKTQTTKDVTEENKTNVHDVEKTTEIANTIAPSTSKENAKNDTNDKMRLLSYWKTKEHSDRGNQEKSSRKKDNAKRDKSVKNNGSQNIMTKNNDVKQPVIRSEKQTRDVNIHKSKSSDTNKLESKRRMSIGAHRKHLPNKHTRSMSRHKHSLTNHKRLDVDKRRESRSKYLQNDESYKKGKGESVAIDFHTNSSGVDCKIASSLTNLKEHNSECKTELYNSDVEVRRINGGLHNSKSSDKSSDLSRKHDYSHTGTSWTNTDVEHLVPVEHSTKDKNANTNKTASTSRNCENKDLEPKPMQNNQDNSDTYRKFKHISMFKSKGADNSSKDLLIDDAQSYYRKSKFRSNSSAPSDDNSVATLGLLRRDGESRSPSFKHGKNRSSSHYSEQQTRKPKSKEEILEDRKHNFSASIMDSNFQEKSKISVQKAENENNHKGDEKPVNKLSDVEEGEILSDDSDSSNRNKNANFRCCDRQKNERPYGNRRKMNRSEYLNLLEENKRKMEIRRRNVLLVKAKERMKNS